MKCRINILLWLFVWTSGCLFSCSRPSSDEPDLSGDSTTEITPGDTALSWLYMGDYTEDISSVASSPYDVVRIGVLVEDELASMMQNLSSSLEDTTKVGYILEFTDTTSAIDYHYLPTCWRDVPAGQVLADTVYQYTKRTLSGLPASIQYVQISRDISHGLLWHSEKDQLVLTKPMSADSSAWQNQALYIKAAIRAIREVCPETRIVLQTSKVGSTESLHEQLPRLINNWAELGIDYDVLSFYVAPAIHSSLVDFENGLSAFDFNLVADKELHFETFYPCSSDIPEDVFVRSASKAGYPYTSLGQRDYLQAWKTVINNRLAAFKRSERTSKVSASNTPVVLIYRHATSPSYFRLCDYQYLVNE